MERSLLDTDIFSETLRGRDQAIRAKADGCLEVFSRFTLSVITVTELVDGFRRQQRDDRATALLAEIEAAAHEILVLDYETAKIASNIFSDLHRTGRQIGNADPFIAAIAIRADIPLVTGNTKHFERIQDLGYSLRLEDWRVGGV